MVNSFRASLIAAALVASACVPAGAQTLQTVNVVSTPVDVTGNLYYAIDQGFFTKNGLSIQVTTIANPALIAQAVAGGTVDVGTTNLVSIVRAHEGGFPLVIIAPSGASSKDAPLEGIVVNNSAPITSAKDLNGKTMVVSVKGSIIQVEALAWIDKHGGDWQSINWIESPPAADGALIASGAVPAGVITETFLSSAVANGDGKMLTYVGPEVSPLLIEGGYFCSEDYAKAHPDIVKKFNTALLQAGTWANHHRAEAAAIMQKYSKQTPSPTAHHAVYPESFKAADLQPVIDAAVKYGALKSPIDASEMVAPGL